MIELITREGCFYCSQAKDLLVEKNIPFTETKIGIDIDRDTVIDKYPNQKVLPIVIENDKVIGSWADLLDYVFPPMKDENNESN